MKKVILSLMTSILIIICCSCSEKSNSQKQVSKEPSDISFWGMTIPKECGLVMPDKGISEMDSIVFIDSVDKSNNISVKEWGVKSAAGYNDTITEIIRTLNTVANGVDLQNPLAEYDNGFAVFQDKEGKYHALCADDSAMIEIEPNMYSFIDKEFDLNAFEELISKIIYETQTIDITYQLDYPQLYLDFFKPYASTVGTEPLETVKSKVEQNKDYKVKIQEGNENDQWVFYLSDEKENEISIWFYPTNIEDKPSDWKDTLTSITFSNKDKLEISVGDDTHIKKAEYKTYDPNRIIKNQEALCIEELEWFMFSK